MSVSAWLAASVLAVTAVLASCGGGESSQATPTPAATASPVPETPIPTATPTVNPSPTAVRTPPPTASPTPAREASPTATPSPPPTVTPSPTPTPEPVVIEYTELTLGEPRYQPPGYALFSGLRACFWNCQGGWVGLVRSVWDEQAAELLVDDLIAPLRELGYHINTAIDDTGTLVAAAMCVRGDCGGVGAPSPDARQEVWVSRDGGDTWETWGTVPPFATIARVTEDDVAVRESTRLSGNRFMAEVRWVRSGEFFRSPDTRNNWVVAWDGDEPVWGEWGPPPSPPSLSAVAPRTWRELQARPDGSTVWWANGAGEPLLLLAVVDAQSTVGDVYGWPAADYVDWLVPMGEGLFVGFRMEGGWTIGREHLNFLIDLGARTVHPLLGLPDGEEGFAEPWRAVPLPVD